MTMLRRLTLVMLQVALLALPMSSMRVVCSGDRHEHRAPDAASQCDSMQLCAPMAMAADQIVTVDPTPPSRDDMRAPLTLVSVTRAPEPPPPRA